MAEKKYLKWYNMVGYGSGDIAGNVVYAFLTSFVMIYLTNTIGLDAGIVGTLIAVSKLFDGVTDVFFGNMIDRTKSKMGKARPWMFYGFFGCAVTLFAVFAIPTDMGQFAQYAWFFIAYTLLNAVFYTANNIAYSALTSLVTKNSSERVKMGSFRFIFAFSTSLFIQTVTVSAVEALGNDANAWRTVAFIYCILGIITNTLSVFSVKELSEEELNETDEDDTPKDDNLTLAQSAKLLFTNKYYVMISGVYILQQLYGAMLGVGIYFMTYVLGNKELFGVFSWAVNIPLIIALVFTPNLVAKWNGMYKLNKYSYMIATAGRLLVVAAGYMGSVPLMLLFTAIAAFGQGPWQGDMNAVIASCSEYTYLTKGKRIDGSMYSCTSLGVKIGGGIGTALSGWMLSLSGFVNGDASVQPDSCINMMYFMYLWLPFILDLIITVILSFMNVEESNKELKANRKDDSI
ncbi:MAG: MFS transporter [Roseburia sp.]|nr:MFS transporter [Roseburia sp.]